MNYHQHILHRGTTSLKQLWHVPKDIAHVMTKFMIIKEKVIAILDKAKKKKDAKETSLQLLSDMHVAGG